MAFFDPITNKLVIQVVYDGAPYSGKTESVRALAQLFGREVETPEEVDGRTMLFDWMQHEGGERFGRAIDCRVVSVPGQADLAERRRTLLQAADALIFVVDTTVDGFERSVSLFHEITGDGPDRVDAPMIVQLNKRDRLDTVNSRRAREPFAQHPSVKHIFLTWALERRGIRESFVLAVSHAVRRFAAERRTRPHDDMHSTQPVRLLNPQQLTAILAELEAFGSDPYPVG
ncbi:MAG: GTPase domain-containing protein [Acidobacteriota bacterium]